MKAVVGGFTQRSATTAATVTSDPGGEREQRGATEPRQPAFATLSPRGARARGAGHGQPAGVTRRALFTSIGVTGTSW